MQLYVANASKQVIEFQYRTAIGQLAARRQSIRPGAQIRLSGSLTGEEVKYVVETMSKYGMVAVEEANNIRSFHGMIYSVDKPVTNDHIVFVMQINKEDLIQRGHELRKMAAIATNNAFESQIEEQRRPEQVVSTEVEVTQTNYDDRDVEVDPVNVVTEVTRDQNRMKPDHRGNRHRAA